MVRASALVTSEVAHERLDDDEVFSFAALVNLFEADSVANHCAEAPTSFGSLIHETVGSVGGTGGLRRNRSGWSM
jgi:hypothetical protein